MNYFITGTDTGVGKTFVTAVLLRALRKAGLDAAGMKPICCGGREDAEALRDATGGTVPLNDINPVWLRTPAAPYAASLIENRAIDLDAVREAFARLRALHSSLLVEGVGGWLVPIQRDYLVSDLAAELGLPVVVVAANRLGALNHTLLTVRNIQSAGLKCAGVILNEIGPGSGDPATATNASILETLMDVPILFQIGWNQRELQFAVA
jgi:dethiobiotin synthetase